MKVDKNIIVTDTKPGANWNFAELLSAETNMEWTLLDGGLQYKLTGVKEKLKRYVNFVVFPCNLVVNRKKIKNIIAWQQYYGLFYALFSKFFHLKKRNYCMIMTFIYNQRKGIFGKFQYGLVKALLHSCYIDSVLVHSQYEKVYYEQLFSLSGKFQSVNLGLEDLTIGIFKQETPPYILSAGRSNRDYDFLFRELGNTEYPVKIVCDALREETRSNIQVYDHVHYEKFFQMLADCYCVVISLDNPQISSGQLVILQAMQFGKPVIVTESLAVRDYIQDGKQGYIIKKDGELLRKKIELLYKDKNLYKNMAVKGRKTYEEQFSMEALSKQVAEQFFRTGGKKYDEKKI